MGKFSIVTGIACAAIGLVVIFEAAAADVAETLIVSDGPFYPSGQVSTQSLLSKGDLHKVEEGEVNGVRYRFFYTDGSGSFAGKPGNSLTPSETMRENWRVGCNKDIMSDRVSCYAKILDLTIVITDERLRFVRVGKDHYPGSEVANRAGRYATHVASSGEQYGCSESREILSEMQNGTTVSTRYQEWPRKSFRDQSFELYGFEEVYAYIQWAVAHAH